MEVFRVEIEKLEKGGYLVDIDRTEKYYAGNLYDALEIIRSNSDRRRD